MLIDTKNFRHQWITCDNGTIYIGECRKTKRDTMLKALAFLGSSQVQCRAMIVEVLGTGLVQWIKPTEFLSCDLISEYH